MYVIRPQFLSYDYTIKKCSIKYNGIQKELAIVRNQNIDISNFENEMNDFKISFQEIMNWLPEGLKQR